MDMRPTSVQTENSRSSASGSGYLQPTMSYRYAVFEEDLFRLSEEDLSPGELHDADEQDRSRKGRNMFFEDGERRIDFILAYSIKDKDCTKDSAVRARTVFEANLEEEGLKLEYDKKGDEIHYVKVHATFEVLTRYAEILKIRMPLKETHELNLAVEKYAETEVNRATFGQRLWQKCTGFIKRVRAPFELDAIEVPKIEKKFTCPFSRDKDYLFDMPKTKKEEDRFFNCSTRSLIVDFILRRKHYSADVKKHYSFGIRKMLADGYYVAAYPMHEGHWKEGAHPNPRKLLFDYWAYWRNFLKLQPLDHIRLYYGEKIGLYFAWLGFYTNMLIPASIVGLIVFIYGTAVMYSSIPSKEICDKNSNITMCPLCALRCPYWQLHEACSHAAASLLFDNAATVFFAVFMSLWEEVKNFFGLGRLISGTLFLEFWKRKEAVIVYKWDLINFQTEEEPPRPEYLARLEDCKEFRINPVTGLREPHIPFWRKRFPVFMFSWSLMIFMAAVAIASVIGVIAYRVSTLAALQVMENNIIYENASLVTTATAATINLAIIMVLNIIYRRLAFWVTDMESLRTQSEYDDSITLKLFGLQFVNYYSSIMYIAFFKGRFVGRPGKYHTLFGARQEECEPGGCLIELCIQLAIIMVGKQFIQNNLMEIIIPKFIKFVKRKCSKLTKEQKLTRSGWEKDFILDPATDMSLFYEYMEMVLQFGFLTIFVAAFPLGAIFALLNNIMEIRSDGAKFITHLQRPVPTRSADIGIWFQVLYGISRIAVVSNAFIISLTSEFIPRLVYQMRYSPDNTMHGYVNFSLSYFNTNDFAPKDKPLMNSSVQLCRYRDFRNPPWERDHPKYVYSDVFWHVLAARLAFVVVFENVVVVVTSLISWLIPDMPAKIKHDLHREAYITSEAILQSELQRMKEKEKRKKSMRHAENSDSHLVHRKPEAASVGSVSVTV